MKNLISTLKRQVLLLVSLCGTMLVAAQTIDVNTGVGTVTINAAGDLATAIGALNDKSVVTELQVSSPTTAQMINATDIAAINTLTALKTLDCSGITMANYEIPATFLNNNTTVETFVFPPNTTGFGSPVFNSCALKGTVTLPSGITNFAFIRRGFDNCQNITAFAATGRIYSIDGVLYATDNNGTILRYPCGKEGDTFEVPAGIATVDQNAFSYNKKLKKISFPASLATFLAPTAIVRESTALEEITVAPENTSFVSVLGILVNRSTNETVINPPANTLIKTIETFTVNADVFENVPANFFANATNLKKIVLAEGVKTIGANAFRGNGMLLETVYFPASLTSIGGDAFNGCYEMKTLVFKGTTPPTLANANTFRECGRTASYKFNAYVPNTSLNEYKSATWGGVNVGIILDNYKPHYSVTPVSATATVNSPAIEGIILQNDIVNITADAAPEGKEFDRWMTINATLIDDTQASASFSMPANDVTVEATYKASTPNGLDNVKEAKLSIYPNPATDYIQLSGEENHSYAIYNVVGQLVLQGVSNGNPIAISQLANGTYVVKANGESFLFIKK